ncbi:MAG: hypothetical protein LBE56_10295, partial [Tannerella sp.]|nr:hypothetical protein [Tannerella sp.]
MKKQFLLVGVVVMVGLGVFLWSCTDSGKEDEDFEDETNLSAPVLRIGGPYNCDILEWDLIEGAEKYNLLESESRAELERINRPAYNSNTGGQYLSYGALYQNYLTLCDKAFNR